VLFRRDVSWPPALQARPQCLGLGDAGLDIATLIAGWIDTDDTAKLYLWLSLIGLAASVFFGAKANDMAAKHAVAHGWKRADRHRRWFD
jgi:hypothetical protein